MSNSKHVMIIAEAGVNHNGSVALAKRLIEAARDAGADVVKFQTFKSEKVISTRAKKAEYQVKATGADESQLEMVKRLEFSKETFFELRAYADQCDIEFMSTPFDAPSIDVLAKDMNLPTLKIPSGEITNAPYLFKCGQTGKRLIVSTGMATIGEVETALGILALGLCKPESTPSLEAARFAFASAEGQKQLRDKVTLLHCTTEYPAPYNEVNLRAMDTLANAFGLPVGYSDHTAGIAVPIAAAARGAVIIEKHFTLDHNLEGPDHKASLEPQALKEMVTAIRQVESALGRPEKFPTAVELKNLPIVRRSVVAAGAIKAGETFTAENLDCKRPAGGVPAMHFWDLLGRKAERNYEPDEEITSAWK